MSIQLCILDFDGTLCDSEQAIINSLQQTFVALDHEAPCSETIASVISHGISLEKTLMTLSDHVKHDIDRWINQYRDIYHHIAHDYTVLFDGVKATLETLSQYCPLVILSQKVESVIQTNLKRFDIDNTITLAVGARDEFDKKPSPDLYHYVIAKAFPEIKKEHTIMVGDTPTDLQFANNVGIRSVWARYGSGNEALCLALNPHHIIQDFSEVLDLFINGRK